tara:strand:- start:1180 stop:2286 length:1107 start_codon:yes stop_codon:yes gene_type:complete
MDGYQFNSTKKYSEEEAMRLTLALAKQKKGETSPNPMTAAVILKDQKIISIGIHEKKGTPHAEAIAIKSAGKKAKGATIIVNLEPCTHQGDNPPCVSLIIKAGLVRVVYAMDDPNPKVRKLPAKEILSKNNIAVVLGVLKKEALELNEVFVKNIRTQKPFVTLKVGISMDAKIGGTNIGYITSEAAQKRVHEIRYENTAILVGVDTILHDNPQLNIRGTKEKSILKIVLDSKLRTPLDSQIFDTDRVVIFTDKTTPKKQVQLYSDKAQVIGVEATKKGLSWPSILEKLYAIEVYSVLIEGGARVIQTALNEGIIDKVIFHIEPKMLGEQETVSLLPCDTFDLHLILENLQNIRSSKKGRTTELVGYLK